MREALCGCSEEKGRGREIRGGGGGDKLLIFDPPSLDYSRETRGGGGNRFLQPSLQHS